MGATLDLKRSVDKNTRLTSKVLCAVAKDSQLVTICKCDDLNDDGTNIVPYIEAHSIYYDGETITSNKIGDYLDDALSIEYTPSNPVDCNEAGETMTWGQGRVVLDGASWSPGNFVMEYQVYAISAGGAGTSTFDDSFGNVTTLTTGDRFSFSCRSESINTNVTVTAAAGHSIEVTYVELTT